MSASTLAGPMAPEAARYRLGLLFVTVSAVSWSTAGFFTRLIPLDIWTTLFWRGTFGTLTALAFIVLQERGRAWRAFSVMGWHGLAFSLLSTVGMVCFLIALKTTTVAHVSIIYATAPFISAALAWLTIRETTSIGTLCAIALAVFGVGVTLVKGGGEGSVIGDVAAFMMTLVMAISIVIVRRSTVPVPTLPAACLSALLSALVSLPFADVFSVSPTDLAMLAGFGISNMGLGLIFFMAGAKLIPAAQTALIGALDAPLAPIWVWLAFGETPRLTTIIGGGVVLIAVTGHILLEHGATRGSRRGNGNGS